MNGLNREVKLSNKRAWSASSGERMDPTTGVKTSSLLVGKDSGFTLQCDFQKRPDYYTVQFNIQQPSLADLEVDEFLSLATLAELTWSVEGNSVRRLISVQNGGIISGCGQAVRVRVFDWSRFSKLGIVQETSKFPYKVSCQVTKGTRPSAAIPPMLTQNSLIEPGGEVFRGSSESESLLAGLGNAKTWQVPQNVGLKSLYVDADAPQAFDRTDFQIIQLITPGVPNAWTANLDQVGKFIPALPGVTQVRMVNTGASGISVNLNYGIEG